MPNNSQKQDSFVPDTKNAIFPSLEAKNEGATVERQNNGAN